MKFNKTSSALRGGGCALDLKTQCNQNRKLLLMNTRMIRILMMMMMIWMMIMLQIDQMAVQHKQAGLRHLTWGRGRADFRVGLGQFQFLAVSDKLISLPAAGADVAAAS